MRDLCEGGGNYLKYLERGGDKGEQAGSRGGCLKKAGWWNPLTNYV